jgi:hypothetical protein
MGTIHHHVAVATTWNTGPEVSEAFERVVEFAKSKREAALNTNFEKLLVGPLPGVMNGYVTDLMIPDGSKEWWSTSDIANEVRVYFLEQMGAVMGVDVFLGSWGELNTTGEKLND